MSANLKTILTHPKKILKAIESPVLVWLNCSDIQIFYYMAWSARGLDCCKNSLKHGKNLKNTILPRHKTIQSSMRICWQLSASLIIKKVSKFVSSLSGLPWGKLSFLHRVLWRNIIGLRLGSLREFFLRYLTHLISLYFFMTRQTRQLPMMFAMMSRASIDVTAISAGSDIIRNCQWQKKYFYATCQTI